MKCLYLCKERLYDEIEHTSKQLISHEDGEEQVTEHKCTRITPWILPDADGREDETNKV